MVMSKEEDETQSPSGNWFQCSSRLTPSPQLPFDPNAWPTVESALSKDLASKEGRNVIASVTLSNGSLRPLHISKESKWSEAKLITSGVEFKMAPTEAAVEARCKLLKTRAQEGSAGSPEELRHQVTSPHHYEP